MQIKTKPRGESIGQQLELELVDARDSGGSEAVRDSDLQRINESHITNPEFRQLSKYGILSLYLLTIYQHVYGVSMDVIPGC